jgi:formate dehydrogenase subunit gamma
MRSIPWDAPRARAIIEAEITSARGFLGDEALGATALLPILHQLQQVFGFISPEAINCVAHGLNLSKAEVKGVVSFYKDFRTQPASRHRIGICRAEACQANGCEALVAHLSERHELKHQAVRNDIAVDDLYCLGNCALGPAALIDETQLVGRLNRERLDALVKSLEEKP